LTALVAIENNFHSLACANFHLSDFTFHFSPYISREDTSKTANTLLPQPFIADKKLFSTIIANI
jgi:hypothetical protein